jgi:prepilin-type N-terminal cleavage/methylation domain-containing protein/prepilin-type processing-associated H-X9-DG protein
MNSISFRKNAFTLIEVLVVVAVIGILCVLLLPVLSQTKAAAKRTMCLNNLRQVNLGTRMYCDDSNDLTPGRVPGATNSPGVAYKELMKGYVGLHGKSSERDRLFACPADVFYYDWIKGYVAASRHDQARSDYSSYVFNSFNLAVLPTNAMSKPIQWPGVGGMRLSSIKHPARTILIAEAPAYFPYSWHEPKPYEPGGVQPRGIALFNDARNVISFADGHVAYAKIYWGNIITNGGFMAAFYDPPEKYDYQWSAN